MFTQTITSPTDRTAIVRAAVKHAMRRSPVDLGRYFGSNALELGQSFAKCRMHSDGARIAERCPAVRHHDLRLAHGSILAAPNDVIEGISRLTKSPSKEIELRMRDLSGHQKRSQNGKNRNESRKFLHGLTRNVGASRDYRKRDLVFWMGRAGSIYPFDGSPPERMELSVG